MSRSKKGPSDKAVDVAKPHWAAKCCRVKRMPLTDNACNCDIYRQEFVYVDPKAIAAEKARGGK